MGNAKGCKIIFGSLLLGNGESISGGLQNLFRGITRSTSGGGLPEKPSEGPGDLAMF